MFERFTDRARKVMQLANQEARCRNHEYIGTEHMLLGLVKEGAGVAANVLRNLDIDLPKIYAEVTMIVPRGPAQVLGCWGGRLPQTPRAKKVIEYAIEEARRLGHHYVGTEHLLLGLLREEEGVGAQVLMNLGLKLEDVREEVLNLLGENLGKDPFLLARQPVPPAEAAPGSRVVDCPARPVRKEPPQVPGAPGLAGAQELRLQALESQLRNARVVLGVLVGTLVGGLLGGERGVVIGLALGTLLGLVGGRVLGAAVGGLPGALLAATYLHGEGWAPVGFFVGAVLGAFVGDLGRPPRPRRG
jgi:hypothetical protein